MQAISGAGYPGVPSMDIIGNVIPYIGGEEEKMEQETQKILGDFAGDHIEPLAAKVSAHCNRVPVVDGHTDHRLGGVLREALARPTCAHALRRVSAACRRSAICRARRRSPVIYMDEAEPPAAAQGRRARARHGGLRRPPAPLPGARLQVRRAAATTPSAAPPARPC